MLLIHYLQCIQLISVIKMKKANILYNNKALDKSYIYIYIDEENIKQSLSNNEKHSKYISILLKQFMIFINSTIGAKTTANYHIEAIRKNTIVIPIYVYTNDEAKMDPFMLVKKRVSDIRNLLEHFNWNNVNKYYLWIIRSLHIFGLNISNIFKIRTIMPNTDYPQINDDLLINFPTLSFPKVNKYILSDKSIITVIHDEYFDDYGLFVNLSVPFDEMGMSYNSLHLYEHLLTKPWSNISSKDLIELNGCTYPVGVCYVYTIHKTQSELMLFMDAMLDWLYKSRCPTFWDEHKDDIQMETVRTISETRTERSLTTMGRSDYKAYNLNYNTEIFKYWSNKPFNITITTPVDIKINDTQLNKLNVKYPMHNVIRPENPTFKHFPIDVLRVKSNTGQHIVKLDTNNIKEKLTFEDDECISLFGIDCEMLTIKEDLSVYNSVLHPLVFLNQFYTEDELTNYLKTNVIPFSSKFFSEASLNYKYASNYIKKLSSLYE